MPWKADRTLKSRPGAKKNQIKHFKCKPIITAQDVCPVSLSFSSLCTFISFSLLCVSSVDTLSDLWPMSKSLVIFVAVLNVAPQAPYQRHTKNSWEQLNMGFNSSLTTEVKIIAQCFQMEAASKELFSYHKLSASPACIPKLNLCRCGTIGTYDKHIYSASQTRPMWNSKAFFFLTCSFFFHCWNWQLNKYVLSMRLCCRILEILCRTGNYICYYRNMSCSGYREIKFLRKSFSFFILKVFSGMRTEITHSSSFAIKCNLEVVRGCPAVVASK